MKIICIIVILFMISTGCTTSTISKRILTMSIEIKEKVDMASISDVHLIHGGGMDWGSKIDFLDGGVVAVFGSTHKSFGESTDYLAVIAGPEGKLIWAKTYGGTHLDNMDTAITTLDGGYLMVGSSQSLFFTPLKVVSPHRPPRPFLVKIDSSGTVQWALTINRNIYNITDIVETSDHGFIAVGTYVDNSKKEVKWCLALLKISNQGKELWSYQYNAGTATFGYNIAKTPDGNLIISGLIENENKEYNSLLLKADMRGNPIWAQKYLIDGEQVLTSMILQHFNGTYVLTGINRNTARNEETMALKLSSDGNLIWAWSYGYSEPYNYEPAAAIAGYNQELLITGQILEKDPNRKGTAMIIDQEGQIESVVLIGDSKGSTQLMSAAKLSNGKFRLLGHTDGFQAKYLDMIMLTWNPKETSNKDVLKSGFNQRILQVKEQKLQFRMSKVDPRFVQIPTSCLQVRTLSVQEDIEVDNEVLQ